MRLRFLDRAITDLHEIEVYIRNESPRGAARIGARIRKRAEDLTQFPYQGTLSVRRNIYQLYVARTPYILIYRVVGDEVQIITIIHTSRRRRS